MPWASLALAGAGLVASLAPGWAEALEYDRALALRGELWRPLTGQLVHLGAWMTLADLGTLLLLGVVLEHRSRRLFLVALGAGAVAVAAGLLLMPDLARYRGSSSLSAAVLFALALDLSGESRSRLVRRIAVLALALFFVRLGWELWTGRPLPLGPLPPDARVVPRVHLIGAIAGASAFIGVRSRPATVVSRR